MAERVLYPFPLKELLQRSLTRCQVTLGGAASVGAALSLDVAAAVAAMNWQTIDDFR